MVKKKSDMLINILFFAASALMPSVLLFVLYNRNHVESFIYVEHVFILSGILAVAGLLLFLLLKIVTKSRESALLVAGAVWLCFWLFSRITSVVIRVVPSASDIFVLIVLCIILAASAICLRKIQPSYAILRSFFTVLAICLIMLFFVNAYPIISYEYKLQKARNEAANADEDNRQYHIKREFTVNPLLPRPDIYWLHADGMMSIETAEKFWELDMDWFRDEIDSRGFVRNENAMINAGYSLASLAAMLSPSFYDSFFGSILDGHEGDLRAVKTPAIAEELLQAGLHYKHDIVPSYELISAFIAAGYNINSYNMGLYMPKEYEASNRDDISSADNSLYNRFIESDLPALLSMSTPLEFPLLYTSAPQGITISDPPGLNFYGIDDTHMAYVWQHDPDIAQTDYTAVHAYPAAYEYTAQKLLDMIDDIQSQDEGAVIIIQADHGFHYKETQNYLLNNGYTKEEVLELTYSVFSAVYIPDKYGGLDAPLNPLNISRELVNRFAGENYALLPG